MKMVFVPQNTNSVAWFEKFNNFEVSFIIYLCVDFENVVMAIDSLCRLVIDLHFQIYLTCHRQPSQEADL